MRIIEKNKKNKVSCTTKNVAKTIKLASPTNGNSKSLKKQFLKNNTCKITFNLPKEACENSKIVSLVGDFNSWDPKANKMKRLKDGNYSLNLNLDAGREYQFLYLIDNKKFENDWNADAYAPNPFGGDNSVVHLIKK